MSSLQIELVKPTVPEEVNKHVFSEVGWAKEPALCKASSSEELGLGYKTDP